MIALDVPAGGGTHAATVLKPLRAGSPHPMRLAELFTGQGPQGHSVPVVHGGANQRWMRCSATPGRQAVEVSWVRRVPAATSIATPRRKLKAGPVFCQHKNHMVIMPADANRRRCSATWWERGVSAASQRCAIHPWRCSWGTPGGSRACRRVRQGETGVWRPRGGLWPPYQPGREGQGWRGLSRPGIARGAGLDGRFVAFPGYPVGSWVGSPIVSA